MEIELQGPPMRGKCSACGIDLDQLAALGETGHICLGCVDGHLTDDQVAHRWAQMAVVLRNQDNLPDVLDRVCRQAIEANALRAALAEALEHLQRNDFGRANPEDWAWWNRTHKLVETMDAKPKLYRFKDGRNAGTVYEIEKAFPEGQLLLRPNPYPNTRDLVAGPIVDPSEVEPV